MKKGLLAGMLILCLVLMSGCDAVEDALGKLGEDMQSAHLSTPQSGSADGRDWSFVPVVREMAVETFTKGFPEAVVKETSVASKNGVDTRVIVTLTYEMNDRTGTYGFDYEKTAEGGYQLTRYGDGVSSDDL